jgi:hypothetical protein
MKYCIAGHLSDVNYLKLQRFSESLLDVSYTIVSE